MLQTDRQFGWPSFDTFQITSETKGAERWVRGSGRSVGKKLMSSFLVLIDLFFLMSTFESAGLCWCCHPHLRVLLTSAAVWELPFLHIPKAVEDNCCGLWEGEAQKKHFQQTSVAEVFALLTELWFGQRNTEAVSWAWAGMGFLSAARYHSDYLSACSFWMKEGEEVERESASQTTGCSLNTSTFSFLLNLSFNPSPQWLAFIF